MRKCRIGFFINPFAGVGGPAAFKGSDAENIQQLAVSGVLKLRAPERASVFLQALLKEPELFEFFTVRGEMGATILDQNHWSYTLVECDIHAPSQAIDSQKAAQALTDKKIDMLIFVGGDGTARDVCSAIGNSQFVLGVPSGVKMHSGVFAISPLAAAEIVNLLLAGKQVGVSEQEVRDIDEEAFREGKVVSKFFGIMKVPALPEYVQHVKQGGREVEELVLMDIAAEIRERVNELGRNTMLIFGPGSTTHFIQDELGIEGTLLGVDVVCDGVLRAADVNGEELYDLLQQHLLISSNKIKLILTAIGGQGHIIGRGNQQLSPEILRIVGRDNIWVVATLTKLEALDGRPLQIDSNDIRLDNDWCGLIPVITGYRDERLYPLGLKTSGARQ